MKVCFVGQLDKWPNAPDHLGIRQGAETLGWDFSYVDPTWDNREIIAEKVNDNKPDLVIHGNTDSLSQHVFELIDAKQIFLMLDYRTPKMLQPGEWDAWVKNAPHIDAVFISARGHVEMWENEFKIPVFFAPHACWIPPELKYYPDFDYDVLFMGGHHTTGPLSERYKLVCEIEERLKALGIKLTTINETDHEKRNQMWTDMPKYYYSSKVVLDISHFWTNPGYCSGRYWYTATLGACAVTKMFPDCDEFFPHNLKVYFDQPVAAVDHIYNLLKDPDMRADIKCMVAEYAWEHHSYAQRFTEMVNCLIEKGVLDENKFGMRTVENAV